MYSTFKLNWTNDPIKILGLTITHDIKDLIALNLDPILEHSENILKIWLARDLTLIGKITVINALIASLYIYKLSVLPHIPESYWKRIKDIFQSFLWNNRKPKIKLDILQGNKTDGGCGLANMAKRNQALKVGWVWKVLEKKQTRDRAYYLMENPIDDDIWRIQLIHEHTKLICTSSSFWHDVLTAWCDFTFDAPVNKNEVKDELLWFNSNILIK